MPRFEQYPLAESLPEDAILLFADPNDLVDGNPKIKRFPASFLPQQEGVSPTITTLQVPNSGQITFPANMKTGDVINLDCANISFDGILFQNGAAGAPPEGTIIMVRNEKASNVVVFEHRPNNRVYLIGGESVALEGNRKAFLTFYVRRFPDPIFYELRQIGGGFY